MAVDKTRVSQLKPDVEPEVEPEVHPYAPEKEDEFQAIIVKDDFYHRTRFEDIVLSLIQGVALSAPERRRNIIAGAIDLALLVEQELDKAQS